MDEPQQNQNDIQELLFEYEQLRKEILQNDTLVLQIMGGTAVLVTAILGVVFTETVQQTAGKGFLVYVATIVTLLGLSQVIDKHHDTFRTASYIRTFDESKLRVVRWETRLLKLRVLSARDERFGFTSAYQLATYAVLAIFTYLLGTNYFIEDLQSFPRYFIAGPIVMGVITAWILYGTWITHRRYILKHAETFDPLWNRIRAEEVSNDKR